MPLYMPERISDLEIQQNPYATFVYFDTVKGDCFVQDNLHVKSAATNANLKSLIALERLQYLRALLKYVGKDRLTNL